MDFETILILSILIGISGTAISLLIWFIQMFVNRKKSLTTGKVVLCFWTIAVLPFIIFGWWSTRDSDPYANIITSIVTLVIAGAMSLIVLIPMAIVKHLEKKKAEREAVFEYTPHTPTPQPGVPRYPAYNTRPEPARTEPIATYKQHERPSFNKPEYLPTSVASSAPPSIEKRAPKQEKKVVINERPGYNAVYRELESRESSGAKFLFNVCLPETNSTIDVVMIDPYGIFVITLIQDLHNSHNAVSQNTRHIESLRSHVNVRDVPYHNIVIASNYEAGIGSEISNPYLAKLQDVRDKVRDLSYQHSLCLLSSDINQIYQKLAAYASK